MEEKKEKKEKGKRSRLLLIAAVLSTLYTIYLISYFGGAMNTSSSMEALGAGLAAAIVTPHMVVVGIAAVFNWIAWAIQARWAALTAGILYAIGMVLMPMYFMFAVLQTIFCFVAFARMKKQKKEEE